MISINSTVNNPDLSLPNQADKPFVSNETLNLGNSIFPGFNDQAGLMICGYEWGMSQGVALRAQLSATANSNTLYTFANKARYYGAIANTWRYDRTIKKWLALWGHPLNDNELGDDFDKSIIQINWAGTQNKTINYKKLLIPDVVDHFIHHIEYLKPRLILFMGSGLSDLLNHPTVLPRFEAIMGQGEIRQRCQKDTIGTRFNVYFQQFSQGMTVCLPHPSGSKGLSYDYITKFTPELSALLTDYKQSRGF